MNLYSRNQRETNLNLKKKTSYLIDLIPTNLIYYNKNKSHILIEINININY